MAHLQEVVFKVLEQSQISPPPGSVPTTTLPLTFFDMPWLRCFLMQRLFFYEFPHSTLHFSQTTLPILKTSLSLTLQHFFPFAAKLLCPPSPHKPYILYTNGDSIEFTVVESTCDMHQVAGNHARDVRELHPFVPRLPPSCVSSDGTRVLPLLAVQVTVFPFSGVCIGVEFSHVAADGSAFNHFMKSWASICRSKGNSLIYVDKWLPSFGRDQIEDPQGLESILLKDWWDWSSTREEDKGPINEGLTDKVRATFVLGKAQIERLKNWVSSHCMNNNEVRLSTFAVTCALIWVCVVKSQESEAGNLHNDDELCYFNFVADCRNRYEFSIPATYFGNCLAICVVTLKMSDIMGEDGIVAATKAIGNKVRELESGALRGADKWLSGWKEIFESGHVVTVAGSPRLRVYETDFGWGKPIKSEVANIDVARGFYLSDSRDEGGIEFGVAISKAQMNAFNAFFEEALRLL
ncbi:Transferase domain-containing protein [Cephalotus follicularis]|uniref:Transferase domain-containing protein n=1 Tax=Cephalotus follicularis TaxID=3775 RepID=A0A1Q3D037_CEPFO|nr:Transferase domain-containing protein [Cephalotus follicularis]